jgi:RNA polymerase sigma-70 factor, ECF subfamily
MGDDLTRVVERAQAGDGAALRELISEYDSPMRRVAHSILHSREDADDAVQEAWIVAVRRLSTLRNPARFPAWLYRVVVRCATRRRQVGASYGRAIDRLIDATPRDQGARSPGDGEALSVAAALPALSQKETTAVSLHYFAGIPLADIARLLGTPLGTVKSRLHHARQTLRREMMRMNNGNGAEAPQEFRKVIAGVQGEMPWKPMFEGSLDGWWRPGEDGASRPVVGVPDEWEVVGADGLVGEERAGGATLAFGEPSWRNVEMSAVVTAFSGGNIQFRVRLGDGGEGWYTVDLMLGWQVVAVHKITRTAAGSVDLTTLSAVNYPLEHQREYSVNIAARGQSITTYVDGALVNQVTDGTYSHGRIALNVWHSKSLYRDLRYRVLDHG